MLSMGGQGGGVGWVREFTGQTVSPSIFKISRLVASIRKLGQTRSKLLVSSAEPSIKS